MNSFVRSHMLYNDYLWATYTKDDQRVSGKLDGTMFNRNEGDEVLYLINQLTIDWGLEASTGGRKLERMLKIYFPFNTIEQSEVKIWLMNNWKAY